MGKFDEQQMNFQKMEKIFVETMQIDLPNIGRADKKTGEVGMWHENCFIS